MSMSFMPTVATLATAGTVKLRELPMSPYAYWAISFASFLVLLGLLWTFRNTAAKYDTPVRAGRGGPGDGPGTRGRTDPGAQH
jgi:bacteriorhodopsin